MNQTCMKLDEPLFLEKPPAPARRAAPVDNLSDPLLAFAEETPRRQPVPAAPVIHPSVHRTGATLFVEAPAQSGRAVRIPFLVVLMVIGVLVGFAAMTTLLN